MLSKKEREYFSGDLKASQKYQRVLEHRIKENLKRFYMLELPLTQRLGITEFSNTTKEEAITITEKVDSAGTKIKPMTRFGLATC